MRRRRTKSPRQDGFSLLELMVATLLGTILAAGIVSVYTASEKDYARNSALGSVQTSARLALGVLDQKIRMAGFFGCGHGLRPASVLQSKSADYDAVVPVQGYEYTGTGMGDTYPPKQDNHDTWLEASNWSPALPPDVSQAIGIGSADAAVARPAVAVRGSDVLLLHEAAPGAIDLVPPYTDGTDGLYVAPGLGDRLAAGNLAVVSDCMHADLFQISGVSATDQDGGQDRVGHAVTDVLTPGNTAPAEFAHEYGAGSQILLYQTYLFYVGRDSKGDPALYEISMGADATLGRPTELASGIESMQFLYGADTDGDEIPNHYLTADQVTDWAQVVSIRVALLARSVGSYTGAGDDASFTLLDARHGLKLKTPADGRIRKVFEETISIRNRLP